MTILLYARVNEIIGHVPRELSSEVCHFLRHGGRSTVKLLEENEKTDWRCCVGYCFVAQWQLIKKLEGLLQNQVTVL